MCTNYPLQLEITRHWIRQIENKASSEELNSRYGHAVEKSNKCNLDYLRFSM